ncbi:hypothetical protein DWB85_19230 [Seongchinamella sediminis]|uniref:Uncharacterized protein n=2 Tax=Seongchinamella sediminis TaxID=2283635 RepID=A0A3L7DU76_9GAMM|nr:hypothetical protein DWB85_19230 [Seongchinamella sediminis]
MQYVALGKKRVYQVLDESGIDSMDFHRVYRECFKEVEDRIAELQRELIELEGRLEESEKLVSSMNGDSDKSVK